jgi:peptidoglycan/LPS O-acetylase OafA/YrhL
MHKDVASGSIPPDPLRLGWVDPFKGIALIWIFLNHASEQIFGGPFIANPNPYWPPLGDRIQQLLPLEGGGLGNIALNLFRWIGWLGDQGVGVFLVLSGFGLTWGLLERGRSFPQSWKDFYARRLSRVYPLWWLAHCIVPIAWILGVTTSKKSLSNFLLSLIGLRVTSATLYAYVPAWWFVGLLLQLYIVFPLLWKWMERVGPLKFFIGAASAGMAARGAGMLIFTDYMDAWLRGSIFITRLPEFALGMIIARSLHHDPTKVHFWFRSPNQIVGSLALLVVGNGLSLTFPGMTVAPLLMASGAFGVFYPILARDSAPFKTGILNWVGTHSYSLYLVHHLIVQSLLPVDTLLNRGAVLRILAAAILSVLAALFLERVDSTLRQGFARGRTRWGTRGLLFRLGGTGSQHCRDSDRS